jgi:hypothetical protein
MGQCVFPTKARDFSAKQSAKLKPWRVFFQTLLVLGSLLLDHPANAGPHYVELPAYTSRISEFLSQHAPPLSREVILKIGPQDSKTPFLLDRPTLCRIEYFKNLLCSAFRESHQSIVTLSEETVTEPEFLHLVDLAYLDRFEVRDDPASRARDLEGLLKLARSPFFDRFRPLPNLNSLELALQLKLDEPSRITTEDRPENRFTLNIRDKILNWTQAGAFFPHFSDFRFLSLILIENFNSDTLLNSKKEDREFLKSIKQSLLAQLTILGANENLTTQETSSLNKELRDRSKDDHLRILIERKIQSLPRSRLSLRLLDTSDDED